MLFRPGVGSVSPTNWYSGHGTLAILTEFKAANGHCVTTRRSAG